MKIVHFFSRRKGLPVHDTGFSPEHLHLPLHRPWRLLISTVLWATVTGAFGALALRLATAAEAFLLPPFPHPHTFGVLAFIAPVAGTFVAVWLLRKWPRAHVPAQLLLVASAMPVGLEGAAFQLGASRAPSKYFTAPEQGWLMLCGITGGLAGVFGAPAAAVALAVTFFTHRRLHYVIAAALAGGWMHWVLSGSHRHLPLRISIDVQALGLYLLVGVAGGCMAAVIVRSVQGLQRLTLPARFAGLPLVAAAIVGVIGWYKPDAYAQGFERTALVLAVERITIVLLVAMSFYRMVAFCGVRGAGVTGGIISPLVPVGAAWGLLSALLFQLCFPHIAMLPPVAALAGAAALLAGVTRGWVFAALLMLEVSGRGEAVLPVAAAAFTGYLVAAVFLTRRVVARSGTD